MLYQLASALFMENFIDAITDDTLTIPQFYPYTTAVVVSDDALPTTYRQHLTNSAQYKV